MENSIPSPRRNHPFLIAALLMALTTAVHVFVGGPEVYDPVRSSDLPPVVRSVVSVIWHVISLYLLMFALALGWLWRHQNPALAVFLLAAQLGFAVIFFVYGLADLGSVWPMPQWTIFVVVSGLIALGLRRPR